MTKITHPEMGPTREAPQTGPKPQTFIVDDATSAPETTNDRLAQFEAPAQDARPPGVEFPLPPKKTISKALEKLIFIGKITQEVEIAGATFELSTLTNREHTEIVKMMYGFSDAADLFTLRILTLANSLKKIDGVELDDLDIDGDFESQYHKRMSIIDNLQLAIVEQLYDEYEKLVSDEEDLSKENEETKN